MAHDMLPSQAHVMAFNVQVRMYTRKEGRAHGHHAIIIATETLFIAAVSLESGQHTCCVGRHSYIAQALLLEAA